MEYRKQVAWALASCCMALHAQSPAPLHPPPPRLPGDATDGHFHFDGARHLSPRAANFGQGVVRAIAREHKMTGGPVVQYHSPDADCKFERHARCP